MEESILVCIKKMLGIPEDYTQFDTDIIVHINSIFMVLSQLGVGPEEGFSIDSKDNTWDEITEDNLLLEPIKTYIYLRVRLLFDPPSSGVIDSYNRTLDELEWRLTNR